MKGRLVASVAILTWAGYLIYDMDSMKRRPDFKERFPDAE